MASIAAASGTSKSILLWSGVDPDGQPFLDPAFVTDAKPSYPALKGEWHLSGRSARGTEIFSVRFNMPELADVEDGTESFVFALPVQPGWSALASITLSGPAGSFTLDRDSNQPMVILRDSFSGQVRGFLRDLREEVQVSGRVSTRVLSPEPGMEVLYSRGIPDVETW